MTRTVLVTASAVALAAAVAATFATAAGPNVVKFRAVLAHPNEAAKEEAPEARGVFTATLSRRTRTFSWRMTYGRLTTAIVEAHVHVGSETTPLGLLLCPRPRGPACPSPVSASQKVTRPMMTALLTRRLFVNLHTHRFVSGELQGRLKIVR